MVKQRTTWKKKLLMVTAVLLTIIVVYQYLLFPAILGWGATSEEYNSALPGDELLLHKDYKNTLAVTVHAPPSKIWPWIAQMGLHKGGLYTYTWLENMFGCNLHNADRIHPEWQYPEVGYYERVCQAAEDKDMPGWVVAIVKERKTLVWKGLNNAQWMMGIYIDSVDNNTSRLITRQQFQYPKKGTTDWWTERLWFEWAHCVMQRGMIQGIKKRAEQL